MVRKITRTSGGWRKTFGAADQHREFERSASQALAEFRSKFAPWRDTAIHKVTAPLTGRPFAPLMLAAFRTFVGQFVE